MVELRCDSGWVGEQLWKFFKDEDGPLGVGEAAPPGVLEYLEGILPASTLQTWRIIGSDGLAGGRHRVTSPLEWAPAVDSWLEGMELSFPPRRWWCVTRTPMGSMQLWEEVSGSALAVKSVSGTSSPDGSVQRDMTDPMMRERMGCDELFIPSEDEGVEDDVTGRSLVDVGFERSGSLITDKVSVLVLAYCLSGRMEAPMLAVEPAVTHVAFLGQSTQPTTRSDMLTAFGGEIADLLAA